MNKVGDYHTGTAEEESINKSKSACGFPYNEKGKKYQKAQNRNQVMVPVMIMNIFFLRF